jgi:hypothetical protein
MTSGARPAPETTWMFVCAAPGVVRNAKTCRRLAVPGPAASAVAGATAVDPVIYTSLGSRSGNPAMA